MGSNSPRTAIPPAPGAATAGIHRTDDAGHAAQPPFDPADRPRSDHLQSSFDRLFVSDQGWLYSMNEELGAGDVRRSSQHDLDPPPVGLMRKPLDGFGSRRIHKRHRLEVDDQGAVGI